MFFLLSKLLAFIITPIIWIIMLFAFALFSKNEERKRKGLKWGFILLLFFSNAFIFNEFVRLWEYPATEYENVEAHSVGIVLGGMSSYDPSIQRPQFYRGVDRLLQAIELYRLGKIRKIVFTGGSGTILHPDLKEGDYIKRYFMYFKIPKEDYYIESESQNTHENAVFTKKFLEEKKLPGTYLLITSGFHMRRSLGCFRAAGMDVDPYSTDRYSGPRKWEFDHLFIPNVSAINDWNNLIHEIVGYITYKLFGYC